MPKITVAVPIYNVKPYLEKCVQSVLGQTERDFELLLIDDGSTDGSGALCDRLAGQDPRIRVIHQENRGLGGARNTGIENAQGEWILFPDSDDWLEPNVLEKALSAAEKTGADMAVFAYRTVDEAGNILQEFRESVPTETGMDPRERKDLLLMAPTAWCRLCKTALFQENGLRFPPRVWYEDVRTTTKLIPRCGKIVYTDCVGYNYLQRAGSIMNNVNLQRNREIIEAFEDMLGWYGEQGLMDKYQAELEYLTVFHVFLTASVRVARIDRKSPLLGEFARFTQGRFPNWRENRYLPGLGGKRRLLLWLLEKRMYGAVSLLFKIKG